MFRSSNDEQSGAPLLSGRDDYPHPTTSDVDRGRAEHRRSSEMFDRESVLYDVEQEEERRHHHHQHEQSRTSTSMPPLAAARSSFASLRSSLASLTRPDTTHLRSRSPSTVAAARDAVRRKYIYASIFLVVTLVSFTAQTELAAWVQHAGWNKAYCMLYLTHGSWSLLWPVQLLILRIHKRRLSWSAFWRRHVWLLRTTAKMVHRQDLGAAREELHAPEATAAIRYLAKTTAFVTCSLTVAGLSWYLAVDMTTPSDLTAIYNCSAFFAYAFSVPLLKERLRLDKSLAVLVAIGGVLIVAYGDSSSGDKGGGDGDEGANSSAGRRFLGNIIIGIGSVLYGLYEVLYKRFACPPDGCSPGRGMIFANTFGSCIGTFTLLVLWIPLPLLHWTGIEPFSLPTGRVAWYLFLSVIMNATFAGSFLVLISLTSPVLSSVASLLTIFIVAVSDWLLTGKAPTMAALAGGSMIVVAFLLLSWSTYREMTEEEQEKADSLSEELGEEEEEEAV